MGDCVASYPGPDCHSSFRLMGGAVSIVHLDRTDGPIGLAIGGGVGGYRTRAPFRVDGQEATTILGVHARAETAVFATGVVTSTIGTQITVFPNVSGQTVTHLSLRLGFRLWGPTGFVDQRDD